MRYIVIPVSDKMKKDLDECNALAMQDRDKDCDECSLCGGEMFGCLADVRWIEGEEKRVLVLESGCENVQVR